MVYTTDHSKAVVPVSVLLFVALCFISTRRFILYLTLYCLVYFSPFSIVITSLGEEGANLGAFRTFDRFALGHVCFFSSWCLGRAAVCNSGIPWTSLLPFVYLRRSLQAKSEN